MNHAMSAAAFRKAFIRPLMKIEEFLSPTDVMIGVRALEKHQLLYQLAQRASAALQVSAGDISASLLDREALGSTGIGGGVAIPHAKIRDLSKPLGMIVRLQKPIDFDAVDGRRVDLIFLLLLPTAAENAHLCALAAVARKLRSSDAVDRMRQARDTAELYAAIAD